MRWSESGFPGTPIIPPLRVKTLHSSGYGEAWRYIPERIGVGYRFLFKLNLAARQGPGRSLRARRARLRASVVSLKSLTEVKKDKSRFFAYHPQTPPQKAQIAFRGPGSTFGAPCTQNDSANYEKNCGLRTKNFRLKTKNFRLRTLAGQSRLYCATGTRNYLQMRKRNLVLVCSDLAERCEIARLTDEDGKTRCNHGKR